LSLDFVGLDGSGAFVPPVPPIGALLPGAPEPALELTGFSIAPELPGFWGIAVPAAPVSVGLPSVDRDVIGLEAHADVSNTLATSHTCELARPAICAFAATPLAPSQLRIVATIQRSSVIVLDPK
jgi:hypothetical protein